MKKMMAALLVCAVLLTLSACSFSVDMGGTPAAPAVNFDLSQYDAHGELSCGLIWVESTTSSYDQAAETSFAYLDTDGNVKSPWFSSEDFLKADFSAGLVVIRESPLTFIGGERDSAGGRVYDTDFNKLAEGIFDTNRVDGKGSLEVVITDANDRGEVFAVGHIESYGNGLFMITKDNIVKMSVQTNHLFLASTKDLSKTKFENGYYIVDLRTGFNYPGYMGIFDEDGTCIFEPSEQLTYTVYSVKVLGDNEFEILFDGADGKRYTATVDRNGTFLTEPQ